MALFYAYKTTKYKNLTRIFEKIIAKYRNTLKFLYIYIVQKL